MSVAPHSGIIDFGTFTSPSGPTDGIQGEVPAPLSGQENYVLTGNGWSSLAALGTLSYQGTWNASTNTPTLVSSVGTQGYYYVVSVAGNTDLNGITTWTVGDWAIFSGGVWQKIEGGSTVDITGGQINGTAIGNITPSTGKFTSVTTPSVTASVDELTLTSVGANSVNLSTANGIGFRIYDASGGVPQVNYWQARGRAAGSGPIFSVAGTDTNIAGLMTAKGTGQLSFYTNNLAQEQFRVSHTASAVNYVQVTGAATGGGVEVSAQGSDANPSLTIKAKGSGSVNLGNGVTFRAFEVTASGSANYLSANSAATNVEPVLSAKGSDTNISMGLQSKGTGAIDLAAGSSGVNISNGGTVTAITLTNAGTTAYSSIPTATVSVPTTAGGVQATTTVAMRASITATTLNGGGTGYTVNDVLTVSGGVFSTAVQITVSTVSAGVITGFTVSQAGSGYTTLPTNPVSVTGGTGTGATFNILWFVNTIAVATAGSGYIEQPTVSFSGGGGSGAAAYATVGSGTKITSLGNTFDLATPAGVGFRVSDVGNTTARYVQAYGATASGTPSLSASAGNLIISSGSSSNLAFFTNSINQQQFLVSHTASAVNYVQVTGAATTSYPIISAQGSDTNISLQMYAKGTGQHNFWTSNGGSRQAAILHTAGTVVNYATLTGNVSGSAPIFSVAGTDTNIDLALTPKGTGRVKFGTYTASAGLVTTGYVEIVDAGGTVRRLAVV